MDISNSYCLAKIIQGSRNTNILSLGEIITILYGCLFFYFFKSGMWLYQYFTTLNLGLPVNRAEIELSLLISRLQKWRKKFS